jgi:hypothetical protein
MRRSTSPTLMVCPVCDTRYTETEGRACRRDCPLQRGCRLLSCPYCAHELPPPTRLTRLLARWFGRSEYAI